MAGIDDGALLPFLEIVNAELGPHASAVPMEARCAIASRLRHSSEHITQLQLENEEYRLPFSLNEEAEGAEHSKNSVLETELADVRAERDSLEARLNESNKTRDVLLVKNNKLDNRELTRRLEEKLVVWLCELVPSLDLRDYSFAFAMKAVKDAMRIIHGNTNVCTVTQVCRRTARGLVDMAHNNGFAHPKLDFLLIALLNKDDPLKYEVLIRLGNYCTRMKNEGNEAAHGSRPEPNENFQNVIADIQAVVFQGSSNDVLSNEIDTWAATYAQKWPSNTPTKMQQRSARTPSNTRTPTQTPPPHMQQRSARTPSSTIQTPPAPRTVSKAASKVVGKSQSSGKAASIDSSIPRKAVSYTSHSLLSSYPPPPYSSLSPGPASRGSGLSFAMRQPNQHNSPHSGSRQHGPWNQIKKKFLGRGHKTRQQPSSRTKRTFAVGDGEQRTRKRHKGADSWGNTT